MPDDAARFQTDRDSVTFRLDDRAVDGHGGANGVAILLGSRVTPKSNHQGLINR